MVHRRGWDCRLVDKCADTRKLSSDFGHVAHVTCHVPSANGNCLTSGKIRSRQDSIKFGFGRFVGNGTFITAQTYFHATFVR